MEDDFESALHRSGRSRLLRSAGNYYLKRGNAKVFVCALDLSKAYDRVPYYNLFIKLLEMGAPVCKAVVGMV